QRLRHLRFAPRRPVEGTYAGRHASRQRGQSVEFADYREYTPGDEPNNVDWKVFGRSDRLFVKLFEHQTNMSAHLLLDASASMGFAGIDRVGNVGKGNRSAAARRPGLRDGAVLKYDHAAMLAGAVAFLTLSQQDRVSLSFAQKGLAHHVPSESRMPQLRRMLDEMEARRETARGRADLARAIDEVHRLAPRRGVLVVMSDLLEETEPIVKALSRWTAGGGEAIVFQTLHRDELHLPDDLDDAVFTDSETGRRVRLRVSDLRDDYHQRQRRRIDAWHAALRGRGIDHNLVSTATPYQEALQRYLFRRTAASS
ncbi:MAG: DUF58 domain-containing protein, partial [Phycisphaeraceae bacterium]